jgi:hypothetical protein
VLTDSIVRAIITLMTNAVSTSETSINFYKTTQQYTPEDGHLRHCFTTLFLDIFVLLLAGL